MDGLCELLREEAGRAEKIIVFAATAAGVERVAAAVETDPVAGQLAEKFSGAVVLHMKVAPRERTEALRRFRDDEARLLFVPIGHRAGWISGWSLGLWSSCLGAMLWGTCIVLGGRQGRGE